MAIAGILQLTQIVQMLDFLVKMALKLKQVMLAVMEVVMAGEE